MATELTPMMRQYLAIKREVPPGAVPIVWDATCSRAITDAVLARPP